MNHRRLAAGLGVALLLVLAVSCTVSLTSFLVPPVVTAGGVFEVLVVGTYNSTSLTEMGAAVLQVPNGVTALDATNNHKEAITVNDPQVLALYKPEPGHYLISFSGRVTSIISPSGTATLRVRLRAPSTGQALYVKLSLAAQAVSTWQINQPAGTSDFANITAEPFARLVVVAPNPWTGAPVYQDASEGLPYGAGGHAPVPVKACTGLASGDIDRDGRDDLVTVSALDGKPHVFLSRGRSKPWVPASKGLASGTPQSRSEVALGDFNGDGFLDIVTSGGQTWIGNGGTSWTPAAAIQLRVPMDGVATGDVDGNGFDDVAFGGLITGDLQVFLSDGKGGFTEASQGLPGNAPPPGGNKLYLGDVDGDGFTDLVWTRHALPGVWLGNGKGGWTEVQNTGIRPLLTHWGVDAADLDGDGNQDLVFGLTASGTAPAFSSLGVYRNLGNARWKLLWAAAASGSGGNYSDVALADFDRDGLIDVMAGRASGVEVWRNLGGFQFKQETYNDLPAASGGNAESVAVGDFNGDTFPDVAITTSEYGVSGWMNERTGFSRFGRGCGGKLPATPAMGFSGGSPGLGNAAFTWTLDQAPASKPAVLVFGLSNRRISGVPALPLDLGPHGAPGCSLLVEPRIVFTTRTDAQGRARISTPVPGAAALLGTMFFGQWGVVDAAANPLGLAVSDGGAAKIGP